MSDCYLALYYDGKEIKVPLTKEKSEEIKEKLGFGTEKADGWVTIRVPIGARPAGSPVPLDPDAGEPEGWSID